MDYTLSTEHRTPSQALPDQRAARCGRRSHTCRKRHSRSFTSAYDYDEDPFAPSLYDPPGTRPATYKLESWLKSPVDLLAFGPRLTAGVVLSLPRIASRLQGDLQRAQMLAQDPRPIPEKQQEALQELDARVADFVERGAGVEADVLGTLGAALPPDLLLQLPQELRSLLEREKAVASVVDDPVDTNYYSAPTVPGAVVVSQTASELTEVREAVTALRLALSSLSANPDPAQGPVLRVNVREARALLARRLAELTPTPVTLQDVSVSAAISEANILLSEVDALVLRDLT